MKGFDLVAAAVWLLPPFVPFCDAHNVFSILLLNGTETPAWKYVRDVVPDPSNASPGYETRAKSWPQYTEKVLTEDIICGRNGAKPHPDTAVADVLAGSEIGFRVGDSYGMPNYRYVVHEGPAFVYLARKPAAVPTLSSWHASDADWFKIDYRGPVSDTKWYITGLSDYNFTIPKTTPPGEYLLRVEDFWPRSRNTSQFYVNCAQINVLGSGGGTPTDFAKFPGTYQPGGEGITLAEGVEYYVDRNRSVQWYGGFLQYVPPGPAVWTG